MVHRFRAERLPAFRSDVLTSETGATLPLASVVGTLVSARGSDPLVRFVTKGARDQGRAVEAFFSQATNDALHTDGLIATADGAGVALVLQPDVDLAPPAKTTVAKMAGWSAWPGIVASLRPVVAARPPDAVFMSALAAGGDAEPSKLVRASRELAPTRALCVDVSREADVAVFEEQGFERLGEHRLTQRCTVWTLVAPPLEP